MTPKKNVFQEKIQDLSLPLNKLKGVGPKRASLLADKGLNTILDLFYFTPIRYENRTRISPINNLGNGLSGLIKGRVIQGKEYKSYPGRKSLFKIIITDGDSHMELVWFHYRKLHLTSLARPGTELMAYGTTQVKNGKARMIHPDIKALNGAFTKEMLEYRPVYSSIEGISNKVLCSVMRTSLGSYLDNIIDPVPDEITNRIGLPELSKAIENVHFPSNQSSFDLLEKSVTPSHLRLTFDRFFYTMLTVAYRKKMREKISKPIVRVPQETRKILKSFFPFDLTTDQLDSVKDIVKDMTSGKPMSRLIMGDVGSGKNSYRCRCCLDNSSK